MVDAKLLDMIKRHEGFRSKPYVCTQGYLTVGYGRNLDSVGITKEEAEELLRNDVYKAIVALDAYDWFNGLDYVRQDALTDFMFNVGSGTFAKFKKMIAALKAGDYDEAALQLMDSRYADQVGQRANEIAYMIRTGRYM